MANTLTGLIPTIYAAMDRVSRELVGFIGASTVDATAERAAVNQTITTHIAPAGTAEDITAAVSPPDTGDQVIAPLTMSITKSRAVPFRWTGEERLSVGGSGPGAENIRVDQISQALRTLANEVEVDLAAEAYKAASRATGTAGTTPFASDLGDSAQLQKILDDNGAPAGDRQLVLNTSAAANLNSLAQLTRANEAGSDAQLRRGELLDLHGFAIRKSAGIVEHTKGTGTGFLINKAGGHAVGDTALTVDTGTGTILAGDVITIAGDTNKYLVTGALAANVVTIGKPGLRQAAADDAAITVGADHTPSVGFHRSSLVLLARQPALPDEGDAADDRMTVTDPVSGLSFEFAVYKLFRQVRYQVGLAWGVKGIKNEHTGLLLG